ncbi:MAG: hypothetical protein ACFFC7_13395 [Candidatus Hermodarchaeota archaeon]
MNQLTPFTIARPIASVVPAFLLILVFSGSNADLSDLAEIN